MKNCLPTSQGFLQPQTVSKIVIQNIIKLISLKTQLAKINAIHDIIITPAKLDRSVVNTFVIDIKITALKDSDIIT